MIYYKEANELSEVSTEAINCVIAWKNKDDFFEDMTAEIQGRMNNLY